MGGISMGRMAEITASLTSDLNTRLIYTSRTNADISIISLHGMTELTNGDNIQIFVGNLTGLDDIAIKSLSLIIHG